jgi:hypothetical protein
MPTGTGCPDGAGAAALVGGWSYNRVGEGEEATRAVVDTKGEAQDDIDRARVLLGAGTVLAAEGPARATLKWIAREAGVDVATVEQVGATVGELLGAVLDDLADRIEAGVPLRFEPIDDRDPELGHLIDRYSRVLTRALLDGVNPALVQSRFPLIDRLVDEGVSQGWDERTARYRVCQSYVLEWGWRLFSPHLVVACGLADEPPGRPLQELRKVSTALTDLPPVDPA